VSIAPDTVEAWRDDGEQYDRRTGHTFILIDESERSPG
jgi:hypothetical protein